MERNLDTIAGLSFNIRHQVYDSSVSVTDKLCAGLHLVDTPYFSFCADDDIVFPESVEDALNFLRVSRDYVGADGLYLNFDCVENTIKIGIEYGGGGFDTDNSLIRTFLLLQRYESLFYGVYRKEYALTVFQYLVDLKSLHFQELFQSVAVLLIGKVHKMSTFYAGRQQCEPADKSRQKWQTYYWFAENRIEFLEHYTTYRTTLLRFYCSHGQPPILGAEKFIQIMDLAHATFFSRHCPDDYFLGVVRDIFPAEPLKLSSEDNALELLKSRTRRRFETKLNRTINLFKAWVKIVYLPWHFSVLNRGVKSRSGQAYKCVLSKNIVWISGTPKFRKAYSELCCYLNR